MKKILLPAPVLGSDLANLVVELESLRAGELDIGTNILVFNQLKNILNKLEMLGSARIEGNNTTIMEYIEKKQELENQLPDEIGQQIPENILEILNIENAILYCEESIKLGKKINKQFISNVHKLVVKGLKREGSVSPGEYRKVNLQINRSKVTLSDFAQIDSDMENLFKFIDEERSISNAMIKNAVAHHQYVLIHPFDNGNGRTARIFTYACLLSEGFSLVEKVINPTAVFCSNRNTYYDMLAKADTNTTEGMEKWCRYVLEGVKQEFLKIKQLTNQNFVKEKIVTPTLEFSFSRNAISEKEFTILKEFSKEYEIGTPNLERLFPNMVKSRYSQIFKELKERKLILESAWGKYVLNLNGPLTRGVIRSLDILNFLPIKDESIENI